MFNCAPIFYACPDSDPPGDKNLQCETQNLQSVECHWTVGDTYSGSQWNSVDYYLLDRYDEIIPDAYAMHGCNTKLC